MLSSIAKNSHAAPAEATVATSTAHLWTPVVFLDLNSAVGASTHITGKCEAPESTSLLIIALAALMHWLVALETGRATAVGAL